MYKLLFPDQVVSDRFFDSGELGLFDLILVKGKGWFWRRMPDDFEQITRSEAARLILRHRWPGQVTGSYPNT